MNFTKHLSGKRLLILFLTSLALSFSAKAQIPTFSEILKQYYDTDNIVFRSAERSTPYGQQFGNYTFEEWETVNSSYLEPVRWNSFMTADGKSTLKKYLKDQITKSTEIRPGSTGSYSARIFSTSTNIIITKIIANANMTTGQIYAGSTTANNDGNYNFTKRSDENFNTPLTTIPDSLTVWVAFKPKDASKGNARITTTIHGDTDLKQQAKSGDSPADMVCATANQEIEATSTSAVVWKRVTIPFVAGPHNDPRYILTTFNTNKTPGGGSDGDELYIDDICLIYNPTLEMDYLAQTEFDGSEASIEVPFTLDGSMSVYNLNAAANEVIAQLSDADGSFANPIELGRVTTNVSGTINGTIPAGLAEGTYKVRVVSTNYPMESNEADITIKYPYVAVPQVEIALGDIATKSASAAFTPNDDCAQYYFVIAPATETVDAEYIKANGESQAESYTATWENLISNTDYVIYALPVDVDGNNGEIATSALKTQAFAPQVEIARDNFTAKTITATFTPNSDCVQYYVMIAPATETVDAEYIKANAENKTEVSTTTFEGLTSNTEYAIYALPIDVDGFNGEIKTITVTTKALVPQVEITKGDLLTYSISASFAPNADCAQYYFLISAETVDSEYIKENGELKSEACAHTWENLMSNTNYTIYVLPIDIENNEGEVNTLVVKTRVEAGVSEVDIDVEKLSETSARITATPNENTVVYHYIVMTKAEADEIGEDAVMQRLDENENYLDTVDVYTMTVESNVAYYVVAQGKNRDDKWGEVTKYEFVVAGPAAVEIAVEKLSETSVEVTATPNENAVSYKYIVMEKSEADSIGEAALMQRLAEANELTTVDIWTYTVKSNVEYNVVAQAKNADGMLGVVTKVEFMVEYTDTTAVSEFDEAMFEIYPNPASEYVRITSDVEIESLMIFSMDGKMVHSQDVNQEEIIIDVTGFAKGSYIVRMLSNDRFAVRRIIVR